MIRRPPRSTLFPYTTPLPISGAVGRRQAGRLEPEAPPMVIGAEPRHGKQVSGRFQLVPRGEVDRKSTRLNSSHANISYAVFCLKKKKKKTMNTCTYSPHTHII